MWLSVRLRKAYGATGPKSSQAKTRETCNEPTMRSARPGANPRNKPCGLIRTVLRSTMAPGGRKRKNRSSRCRSSNALYRTALHATG
jgi:hypothetical protein